MIDGHVRLGGRLLQVGFELRDPARIAPPPGDWVEWRDPGEGAFTMRIPKGWQVQGGIVRPYIDAWGAVSAKKGGKDSTAISFQSPAMPLFTEPNQTLTMSGFVEGSRYNVSGGVAQDMIVARYPGAKGYFERWLAPQIKRTHPDARLVSCRARPELFKGASRTGFVQTTGDGADGEMELTIGGVKVRGMAMVVTTRTGIPGGISLWNATVGTVCAPPAEYDQTVDIFWRVRDSFAVNPQWAAEEARQQMIRSRIVASAHEEITRTITQAYETRSRSMDEISRKWSNAILGQVDLVDPATGQIHYGVPNGSNHYWKAGSDVIYGTETHTRPDIGATELQNLDDLFKP